jgi:TetR/AcrR family transcriptional regulator, regulator of autoinduction and epiphytic fitness
MAEQVKPRRRYESRRRREQAEQTRADIVTAAGTLFRARGFAVPMTETAAEAGVVVETVYRAFGSKAALFRAVIEALLAGGIARSSVPVEERPAIRAIREQGDASRQVIVYAATQPGIHRRAGPLLRSLRDAQASDPELARLWAELEASRREGQGRFVAMLGERGVLRSDRTVAAAADLLWALTSVAIYDMLVTDRGWSDNEYEVWLAEALQRELLGGEQ